MAWGQIDAQDFGFGPNPTISAARALEALADQRQRLDRALASPVTGTFPARAWARAVEGEERSLADCALVAAPFLCAAALGGVQLGGGETVQQALDLARRPAERLLKRAAKRAQRKA